MTEISLLCPSNRPHDLQRWLDSLYSTCLVPESIELSLVVEKENAVFFEPNWGNVIQTVVRSGQYAINELAEIAYRKSHSPYIFLSGDDTISKTPNWDLLFKNELQKYPDQVVLVYPDDLIFGDKLACYPVTSRLVMDKIPFPLPFKRYAIDDTIFDIVPRERRIYMPNVVMKHLHLVDHGPGVPVVRDGVTKFYPINEEIMKVERPLYQMQEPTRKKIRDELSDIAGIDKVDTKVMIGVCTAEYARRADFYDHFNIMVKPANTFCTFAHGQSPARNRNIIIRQALDIDCTHILFLDDDVICPPDILPRLLAHNKDIVTGLYLMRNHPHFPIAFDFADETGKARHLIMDNYRNQNLVEIVATGLGCVLIRTDVFRAMKEPWIRIGELESDMWCDDLGFYKRARELGYKLWLDTTIHVGHIASVVICPVMQDGELKIGYNTAGKEMVTS
jgi:hypothetical protein